MQCFSGSPGRRDILQKDLGSLQLHQHQFPVPIKRTQKALSTHIQTAKPHSTNPASMRPCTASSSSSSPSSPPARVTAESNFAAACTLLGGVDTSCFRGYVGTWTSFDMQSCQKSIKGSSTDDAQHDETVAAATTAAADAAPLVPVFVDETVNFRLFKLDDPETMAYTQVNMYQGGGRPAASSYKTYLTSDAAPGRPDGYGLREWKHDTSGALWSPDGDTWRSTPCVAEKTLLGLAVADCSLALVNGALPSTFDPQHSPASWWMEAIFKQPGSHARRWGMLHRYDSGKLANTKSMNEDLTEMSTEEMHSRFINPEDIKWQERRDGTLGDLDALFTTHHQQQQSQAQAHSQKLCLNLQGTATTFTFDEQHQIMMQTGPCSWSSQHVHTMSAAAAAAVAPVDTAGQHQEQQVVVQLDLPDWGYSRLPADMTLLTTAAQAAQPSGRTAVSISSVASRAQQEAAADAGSGSNTADVVFELGTVLSNGALARWLLHYDASGGRLLKNATYELYPAV